VGNGPRPSIFEQLRRTLRGADRAEAPALPLGEAVHPVALAAAAAIAAAIDAWDPPEVDRLTT
jgi:hypothetical protein